MSYNYSNEESIYNLIPPEVYTKPRPPRYTSKYPPNIFPSYSTFGTHTTSLPGVFSIFIYFRYYLLILSILFMENLCHIS